jgi:TrmH family RNA methyltransferase
MLLEGERLVRDALAAGLACELLLISDDRLDLAEELLEAGLAPLLMAAELLGRIGKLKSSRGVLALAAAPESIGIDRLGPLLAEVPSALLLVVCGVSDPVNLGALVRSAEAAGAAAMIFVEGAGVSPWNPRALRGSMGSVLRLPMFSAESAGALAAGLASANVRIVRGATRDGANFRAFDWSGAVALWVGGEVGNVGEIEAGFEAVTIPMAGATESLNVTVASSILLFAAGRAEPGDE